MTATTVRQDCLVLPYLATSEPKAEMFAAAVEVLFACCVKTKVFEDGGQWGVVVVEGANEIGDPIDNERVDDAASLATSFDLIESSGHIDCVAEMRHNIPSAYKALAKRARRAFRIEDKLNKLDVKLDAVLAVLIGDEAAKSLGL
jgi:hypothetical protein